MKLTINVDGDLLERVIGITAAATKTEAITIALREIDRRARLVAVLREGFTADERELEGLFDPASDPLALRIAERPPEDYGK